MYLPVACLKSMEFCVLVFTICSLVCATIFVRERSRNGNSFTLSWFQSGGRYVSLRPPEKTKYLAGLEEHLRRIHAFSNDFGPMEISRAQCQLLCSKCLDFVQPPQPPQPLCILKESFCAIRRALKLMQDCCSENWLLKAVEFGNCQQHFLEILLDLQRLPTLMDLFDFRGKLLDDMAREFRPIHISEQTKSDIDDAWRRDTEALSSKLESERHILDPVRCLADQLEPNPSPVAPDDIGKYVTEFDFLKSPCFVKPKGGNRNGIYVFPVTFCNEKLAIKMRLSEEVQEDIQMRNEASFMKDCRHPYAVALLGFWEATRTSPRVPLLLMEFMECNLTTHIERNKSWWWWGGTGGFPALDAINLVLPVAKVMKYLHEMGIVHLDLKPDNILFTQVRGTRNLPEDVFVKLADFGEARLARDELPIDEEGIIARVGTPGYMHPNVWDRRRVDDLFQADVFSFGMVFVEVLTGLSPLEALGCHYPRVFYEKLARGEQVPLPRKTPGCVKCIVESCWNPNPPDFAHICWNLQNAEIQLLNSCT